MPVTLYPGDQPPTTLPGDAWDQWVIALATAARTAKTSGTSIPGISRIVRTVVGLRPNAALGAFLTPTEARRLADAITALGPHFPAGHEDVSETIRRAATSAVRTKANLFVGGPEAEVIKNASRFLPGQKVKATSPRAAWADTKGKTGTVENVSDGMIDVRGIDGALTEKIRGRRGFYANELTHA